MRDYDYVVETAPGDLDEDTLDEKGSSRAGSFVGVLAGGIAVASGIFIGNMVVGEAQELPGEESNDALVFEYPTEEASASASPSATAKARKAAAAKIASASIASKIKAIKFSAKPSARPSARPSSSPTNMALPDLSWQNTSSATQASGGTSGSGNTSSATQASGGSSSGSGNTSNSTQVGTASNQQREKDD